MQGVYRSNIDQLGKVILAYTQAIRKPLPDILIDQANKLSCSDFGDGRVGLFQEARAIAPSLEELFSTPIRMGWRIKRRGRPVLTLMASKQYVKGKKKGQSRMVRRTRQSGPMKGIKIAAGEIERRAAARLYQASGWLVDQLSRYRKGKSAKPTAGIVEFQMQGSFLIVRIVNMRKASEEVNMSHGNYVKRALDNRIIDMLEYINRHLDRVTVKFNNTKLTAPR